MMLNHRVVLVASALAVLSASVYTQAPAGIAQIPVYAGAVRNPAREAEIRKDRLALYADQLAEARQGTVGPMGRLEIRAWRIKAPAEAVSTFYRQQLGALDRSVDASQHAYEDALDSLRPNRTTPVMLDLRFVNFDARLEIDTHALMTADKVRAAYLRVRPPLSPNRWVNGADFEWNGMDASKRRFHGMVSVEECCNTNKADDVPVETTLEFVFEILPDAPRAADRSSIARGYQARLFRDTTYATFEVRMDAVGPDTPRKYVQEMMQKIPACAAAVK